MTQRIIKYRAWDGEQMLYPEDGDIIIHIDDGGLAVYQLIENDPDDVEAISDYSTKQINAEVMQFTGLLDKHGKEIYHNDFIKSSGGDIMLVVWRDDLASFALRKEGWMYDHYFGEAVDAGATEIIGNIYTTPELVDPKMIEK